MNMQSQACKSEEEQPLIDAFSNFVRNFEFPCLGAKAALGRDQMEIMVARDIRSNWDDLRVIERLVGFAKLYKEAPKLFRSFVLIFHEPGDLSEAEFERHLWERVQSLSDKDSFFGAEVDARVAPDPDHSHFSLSFGGEAFFVVGLHPNASRQARRFEKPTLVFNLHNQFEQLREQGRYERMRETIIERDVALSGSMNPMLKRHGEGSEARQYSGRAVDDDWCCPYERRDFVQDKTEKQ